MKRLVFSSLVATLILLIFSMWFRVGFSRDSDASYHQSLTVALNRGAVTVRVSRFGWSGNRQPRTVIEWKSMGIAWATPARTDDLFWLGFAYDHRGDTKAGFSRSATDFTVPLWPTIVGLTAILVASYRRRSPPFGFPMSAPTPMMQNEKPGRRGKPGRFGISLLLAVVAG